MGYSPRGGTESDTTEQLSDMHTALVEEDVFTRRKVMREPLQE